jgi:integrase
MPLKPEHVKAAIADSIDNPKFTRIADGLSLYLMTRNGRGYWQFNYKAAGKVRSKMLGSAADLSPTQARNAKNSFNVHRKDGTDEQPEQSTGGNASKQGRQEAGKVVEKPFGEVVELFLSEFEANWTAKEAKEYRRTLITESTLAGLPVAGIETPDIEAELKHWADTPPTMRKVLMRIGKILDYAGSKNFRDKKIMNPASVKGHFEYLALPVAPEVVNHPAMKIHDVPGFMSELIADGSVKAHALAVLILTGLRTDELRLARWKEIVGTILTVPAERMKGKKKDRRAHSVPLAPTVVKLLGKRGADEDFIFVSARGGHRNPLGQGALREILDKLRGKRLSIDGLPPVPHGFRSTFRDWAAENKYDRDLAERAIAHKVGKKTENAYQRSKLIELRKPLMNAWAKFAMSKV